jgi:hypothetical protein
MQQNKTIRQRRKRRPAVPRGKGAYGGEQLYQHLNKSTLPKSLSRNAPTQPSEMKTLSFQYSLLAFQEPLSAFIILEFRLNSPFDPAVTPGPSETVAGFNAMTQLYESYTVERVIVDISVSNNEPAFENIVGFVFRDTQPSTVLTTRQQALNALEIAPCTGAQVLSAAAGMPRYNFRQMRVHLGDVVGNKMKYLNAAGYGAAVTANPVNIVWGAFLVIAPTDTQLQTNGVVATIKIKYITKFFSVRNVIETFSYDGAIRIKQENELLKEQVAELQQTLKVITK